SQEDGSFALGPLGPGRFTLRAMNSGKFAPSDMVRAEAGQADVTLRLRAGGSFRGRVVDAQTGEGCAADLAWTPQHQGTGDFEFGTTMSGTGPDGTFGHGG